MSQLSICDNCKRVIKPGEVVWRFAIVSMVDEEANLTVRDVDEYYRQLKRVEAKELCDNCKKILDYLFEMRKSRLAKFLIEIESSYKVNKRTKYCKCGRKFQDRGLIINGIEDGICYICGKRRKPLTKKQLKKLIEEGDKDEE